MDNSFVLKLRESLTAVLPIMAIVLVLHFTIAPLDTGAFLLFLIGAVLLIIGMTLFNLGADLSMMSMGEHIGAKLSQSRNLWMIVFVGFFLGTMITIAEPDLQVLAQQVPSIPNMVLVMTVAVGVGILLVVALLRIVFRIKLHYLMLVFYTIVFILAAFTPADFLPVAFDAGGVTTGPITVPFILAMGIGVASVRSGQDSYGDSFGLVGISSVGPIIAVMILGMFYDTTAVDSGGISSVSVSSVGEALRLFGQELPHYFKEVLLALSPILVFFVIFQIVSLKLPKSQMIRIGAGLVYTLLGLTIFLTAVNVGFMPAGSQIGSLIASLPYRWVIIPIGMVIGFFIVAAEPAVHVLNKQVEEISGGAISKNTMMIALSIGIAISAALSMIRVLTGLHILYLLIPGYAIALLLTFFVPPVFSAVAFDSGGVASGPMATTFLLPFAMGACEAVGGNILTDAFGVVAMVAMTPLVTVQVVGLIYKFKAKKAESEAVPEVYTPEDDEIIDLS